MLGAPGFDLKVFRLSVDARRSTGSPMSEPIDFALKPGAWRGDSAFLLNRGRHRFAFDSFPGRMIALAFLGSAADPDTVAALETLAAHRRLVEGGKAAFFAVVSEPSSIERTMLETRFPAVRFLWDGESLASAFGASRAWVVLDRMLRVIDVAPLDERDRMLAGLDRASVSEAFDVRPPAPILALADVLEPELCRHLVDCFERGGGRESGFMQDTEGGSVEQLDGEWKRRRDFMLTDPRLIAGIRARIGRRVGPEIKKAFQMAVTRIERDLVARYDAETGGHFGPHRDDTGFRSRIAGSPSRSISTPTSTAARSRFPNTVRRPSRPPPERPSCSPPRSCTRCRG
jgi:hypothetical protein